MTTFWIFVFLEYTDFSRSDTKTLFKRVEKTGKWYIGPNTANRNRVQKGDKVIFYQAGENGCKFVADATLSKGLQSPKKGDWFSFVVVTDLCFWEKPLSIFEVGKKLSFVKHENPSRYYFQIGIRKLTEDDYSIIMNYKKN